MFTLTATFESIEELLEFSRRIAPATTSPIVPQAESTEKPKASKKKEEVKTHIPLESTTEKSVGTEKNTSAPDTTEVTYNQVKDAVLNVAKVKGRESSLDLLALFDVVSGEGKDRKGNITNLKPEQYADVLAKAKEILA